jgi:hypothetical protein
MESKIQLVNEGQEASQGVTNQDNLTWMKTYRQMGRSESIFNPDTTKLVEHFKQGREILFDQVNFALFSGMAINEEPTTFDQARNQKHPKGKDKWRKPLIRDEQERSMGNY